MTDGNEWTRRNFLKSASHAAVAAGISGAAVSATLAAPAATQSAPPLAPPDKQPPDLKLPEPAGRKLGYAIVGLGVLALEEVLPAIVKCKHSRPVALVSGHPDKAKKVAAGYGVDPKAIYSYENFDTIKDNPEVDVVYVILPNSMHAEYSIRAFAAGKHVLCEKPLAPTVAECQKMIDAGKAAGKKFMTAYRLRHEPFNQKMIEIARAKTFGKIKLIEAANVQDTKAPNIRLSKATAGGPLGDVGIYCLNATRYITGEEPMEVSGAEYQPADDPRFREVPESVVFRLKFPSGVLANCSCGFGAGRSDRYRVMAAKGWYELDLAFSYRGQKLQTSDEKDIEQLKIEPVDHFKAAMDYFSDCILNDKPVLTAGEEGLQDVKIMTAINEAIRTGGTVKIV